MRSGDAARSYLELLRNEGLTVRPALWRWELNAAYALVYRTYHWRGYVGDDPSGLYVTLFNMLPDTVTFVGIIHNRVVAALTLLHDGPLGLPMDELFREDLTQLRTKGHKLAEVAMFGDRRVRSYRRTLPMLTLLLKRAFDYCEQVSGVQYLCTVTDPVRATFYRERLMFEPLGDIKAYQQAPEIRLAAGYIAVNDIAARCREKPDMRRLFLENRTPLPVLKRRYTLGCRDLRYFLIEMTSLLEHSSPKERGVMREAYPECPWDDWTSCT